MTAESELDAVAMSPLAVELFEAGMTARREWDEYDDGTRISDLDDSQRSGWAGVAAHVEECFVRATDDVLVWKMRAIHADERERETQSRLNLMYVIALCMAGLIVVVAYTAWRAAS